MKIPVPKLHGETCWFENSSYNCPRLGFYGYRTELSLSRRIARHRATLAAQSQLCREYAAHLTEAIHSHP